MQSSLDPLLGGIEGTPTPAVDPGELERVYKQVMKYHKQYPKAVIAADAVIENFSPTVEALALLHREFVLRIALTQFLPDAWSEDPPPVYFVWPRQHHYYVDGNGRVFPSQ